MRMTIRVMVLLTALWVFGGCASLHRTPASPDPSAATDNTTLASNSETSSPGAMASDSANDASTVSDDADQDNSAYLDATLGDSDDSGSQPPEKSAQALLDEASDSYQNAQTFQQNGDLDNALDALDQTYALILKVDSDDDANLIQQKDNFRLLISQRIQEIYTLRYTVASLNHNEIPMDEPPNANVLKEIKSFQGPERNDFLAAYKLSGKYRARIVKDLKEKGLPQELSWLPLIESGFKVRAFSSARALGLWQFIASTGYKYGLKRNTYVDERLDPEKATEAAIAYLTELHGIFGDWVTALAAYNCGEGRVLRVIQSQNVKYLDNFWDLYQRLPLETARYVPRFLAVLYIINDPQKYGFDLPKPDPAQVYEEVTINRQVKLDDISKKMGIPENELKALNPELRYSLLPAEPYNLKMPPGKGELLLASIDSIAISTTPQNAYARHRVRSGETLSTIAAKYHTSVRRIMLANNLRKSNYIVAGKTLKIPMRGTTIATRSATTIDSADVPDTHLVRQGDSLWIIAKKYGTTVKRIQSLNGLSTTALTPGQRLKIKETASASPEAKTASETETSETEIAETDSESTSAWTADASSENDPQNFRTYVVKKGDSPFTIAKQNNTTVDRLLQINHLSKRSTIYPGQTLSLD